MIIENECLNLREVEEKDLPSLSQLLNNIDNQKLVCGEPLPKTVTQIKQWLDDKIYSSSTVFLVIEKEKKFCGYVQLADINKLNGTAVLGINISTNFRGKGLGVNVMQLLHKYAKEYLYLRKIILTVRTDNKAAISLYKKLAYEYVGTLRKQIRIGSNDCYIDIEIWECFL